MAQIVVPANQMTNVFSGVGSTDWKGIAIEIAFGIAQTLISNFLKDLEDEAQNKASNIRKGSGKAFVYPRRKYRSRGRKFLRPRNIRYNSRPKAYSRRSSNYKRYR